MSIRMLYRYASVSAAFIVAAGCGDAPTAASRTATETLERAEAPPANLSLPRGWLVKRTASVGSGASASTTVTPDGGWLAMPETGLLIYFPAGAVPEDLVVTATAIDAKRIAYDFQPHGTVFLRPIYVAQLLTDTELARDKKRRPLVYAGYLAKGSTDIQSDGSAAFSEIFPAFYQGNGHGALVVFATNHFSGYAMASGNKLPLPRLGSE